MIVFSMAKTFPVELDEELHKRLKIAAIKEGLTLQDWVVKTLASKVDNDEFSQNNSRKNRDAKRGHSH